MNRYTFRIEVEASTISVGPLFEVEFNPIHHGQDLVVERTETPKKKPHLTVISGYCVVAEEDEAHRLVQEHIEELAADN